MSQAGRTTSPAPAPVGPGSRDVLRVAFVLVTSAIVWVALWGDLSVANVVWGVVLGGVTLRLAPVHHKEHRVPVRPWHIVRFAALFLWSLARASAEVAWEVLTPGSGIREGIVAVELHTTSPGLMTLIANVVSLTPGTLTLEVRQDPPTLYIHVLHLHDVDAVKADVHRFEAIALAAFGEHGVPPTVETR